MRLPISRSLSVSALPSPSLSSRVSNSPCTKTHRHVSQSEHPYFFFRASAMCVGERVCVYVGTNLCRCMNACIHIIIRTYIHIWHAYILEITCMPATAWQRTKCQRTTQEQNTKMTCISIMLHSIGPSKSVRTTIWLQGDAQLSRPAKPPTPMHPLPILDGRKKEGTNVKENTIDVLQQLARTVWTGD